LYGRRWTAPAPATGLSGAAQAAFFVDRFYEWTIARPGRLLADAFAAFDRGGIDGTVNASARLTGGVATVTRRLQTGFVRSYALAVLAGAVLVTVLFLGGTVGR
nr:NADH-quinone oxidoreductase subunit L [Euzebyales bacterium]